MNSWLCPGKLRPQLPQVCRSSVGAPPHRFHTERRPDGDTGFQQPPVHVAAGGLSDFWFWGAGCAESTPPFFAPPCPPPWRKNICANPCPPIGGPRLTLNFQTNRSPVLPLNSPRSSAAARPKESTACAPCPPSVDALADTFGPSALAGRGAKTESASFKILAPLPARTVEFPNRMISTLRPNTTENKTNTSTRVFNQLAESLSKVNIKCDLRPLTIWLKPSPSDPGGHFEC